MASARNIMPRWLLLHVVLFKGIGWVWVERLRMLLRRTLSCFEIASAPDIENVRCEIITNTEFILGVV